MTHPEAQFCFICEPVMFKKHIFCSGVDDSYGNFCSKGEKMRSLHTFCIVAVLVYFPPAGNESSLFCHNPSIGCLVVTAIPTGVRQYLIVVLTRVSLTAGEAEPPFTCHQRIAVSQTEKAKNHMILLICGM